MKNFRILLFVAAASLFAACDDAIDITQPSELLPEDTFTSVTDLQLGLNAVYGAVPGENQILFTSIFTDEVRVGRANGGQGVGDGGLSFLLNSNSGDAESIWISNYSVINYANRLIAGSAGVVLEEGEEPAFNNILAQAHALRAFAHLQLLTYFSTDMKDDNALGVIAVDFVPTTDQKLPRNKNADVYTLINSDLDFADANLTSTSNPLPRTYLTKDVITAIRARLAAYRGQYTEAEGFADVLIGKTGVYGLTPKGTYDPTKPKKFADSPYFKLFTDATLSAAQTENIWKLERTVSGPTGNFYQAWSSVNSTITGGAFFEVSSALFNKIDVNDVRRLVVVDTTAYNTGYTIRPVGKYSATESTNLLADLKVFRLSEMYFIKAEAMASRSDFTGVAAQINKVRDARFGNTTANGLTVGRIPVPATAQEAWAAILNERRVELAFEGHRYIDIKRLGALAGAGIDRVNAECQQFNACTLDLSDHRWTLPVPRAELSANPNIQQNPLYNN